MIQVETRVIQLDFVVEQYLSHLCSKATSVANMLNVRYGSLLGPRGLLLIYMWGENSDRENPVIHLPAFGTRLLGACLAPAGHLWYSTSLLFGYLRNHCCHNKPTDALVS